MWCFFPGPTGCSYTNEQSNRYLAYITSTANAFNDESCRRACDTETSFNCRAYSFLSQVRIEINETICKLFEEYRLIQKYTYLVQLFI